MKTVMHTHKKTDFLLQKYSRGPEFLSSCPFRTGPCPSRFPYFLPYSFYRDRNRYRTVFLLTVRSVKRTEPLILTVRFLVYDGEPYQNGNRYSFIIEDREPYCTKMGTVNRLVLRTANSTAIGTAPKLVR